MSGQIAEFWASLGFKIDPKEMEKVDKFLGDAEKRLKTTAKAKTEESKVTDKVTKAAAKEAQAKAAVVKTDVAATKAIDQKTRATRKLTAAEREAQRVGARLRSTPFVNTTVQNRINSMFPAMAGGMLGARSQDRQQLTAFYRGAFDRAAKPTTPLASPFVGRPVVDRSVRDRINSMFPAMGRGMLGARSQDRKQLTAFYRGAFDRVVPSKPTSSVSSTVRPTADHSLQNRINSMFPTMGRDVLGARGQDRRQLTSFYRGAFDQAESGRVGVRNPARAEISALRRIGSRSLALGGQGRVAEYLRQRAVNPEVSALRRIGTNSPRFKPLGSAFQEYDKRLDGAVSATRAKVGERNRLKHLGLMEDRMSHLGSTRQSPEMKSMADFYKRQSRDALRQEREVAKLKQDGLRSERDIERSRRRANVSARRQERQQRLTAATPASPRIAMASYGRTPASHNSGNYLRAGGATGAFARYGVGSLPFIGGALGFSSLNRANQEAITTRLTTQAVLQGQGYTEQEGVEAFDWLRNLGNDIGFSYMDAAQDYNQFLANSLGAGMDVEGSQGIFKGLSEYQTAMGTTPYRRKLINNALSQMMGGA